MISALTWIAKGKLKAHPERYQITDDDIKKLKSQITDEGIEGLPNFDEKKLEEAIAKKYSDKVSKVYEGELPEGDLLEEETGAPEEEDYVDPVDVEDDPYLPEVEDDMEEIDDETIRPTDGIIVAAAAKSEEDEDISRLEVHIYEENNRNLYLHHDLMISSFPLCISYLDCDGTDSVGNFAAVGTFEPAIEVSNKNPLPSPSLPYIMEPTAVLGGYDIDPSAKKKSARKKYRPGSHIGAVMSLSWNSKARNILASGSADTTVKIWDLNTKQCAHTLIHHKKEVQSVEWHPTEPSIMLTGSFDKSVQLLDVRSNDPSSYLTWQLPHDCECIQWNPQNPQYFVVAAENGSLYYYDVMRGSKSAPLWTLNAHSKTASCVAINQYVPLMVTGSEDNNVKLFDISGTTPRLVDSILWPSRVFTVGFYGDSPNLLAVGGETNGVRVLDLAKNQRVVETYQKRAKTDAINTENDTEMMEEESNTTTANTTTSKTNTDKKKKKKKKNRN